MQAQEPILYVDDEAENLEGFFYTFMNRYEINTAQTALEGLEILKNKKIKVVISDQKMPEISGIEFLKTVKETYPETVRIILTAYADIENAIEAINTGEIYRYISKPWNKSDFQRTIDSAIEAFNLKEENKKLLVDLTQTNETLAEKISLLEKSEKELFTSNKEYIALNEEYQSQNEELNRANKIISESEKLLRYITDNIPVFIAMVEAETLQYTFVNRQYEDYFELDQNTFLSKRIPDVIDKERFDFAFPYIEKVRRGEPVAYTNIFNRKGINRHITINYIPVFDFSNNVNSFLILGYDISHLKKIENELLAAKVKAEESDKFKTAFLQNMAHEIRTPMNAIIGFSSLLKTNGLSSEKMEKFTSIIINNTHHLLAVVNDVLTMSSLETKQEKINKTIVNINAVMCELHSVYTQKTEKFEVTIVSQMPLSDREACIKTDKTKLTQIISNLLNNALKFTEKGNIEFGYQLKNEFIEFYVKDSGIGIKKELQDKIFDRFVQADDSISLQYGGSGLGLAISKAFVELLGGKIRVESDENKGASFFFTIPYAHENGEKKSEIEITPLNRKAKILIAEDNDYNYILLAETLNLSGFETVHAQNGEQAVDMCKKDSNFGLVLMDIKMPVMDGYTAAKLIKEFRPELPIIAQSAYALEHEIQRYRSVFDDYVTKPVEFEILMNTINKFTGKGIFNRN